MSGFKASIFWTNYMANAVETLEKLERRLTVSIPVADITTEVEKRLKVRARTAKAPGFRPGKVPMDMVAQQYGAGIQNDVLNEKISSAFSKAVEENNLRVAGYPKFEEKTGDDVSRDEIAFTATFEVYPEVKIGDLAKVELEKAVATVTDAEVDKTLDILRKRQAHFHVKGEDGEHGKGGDDVSAQDGDRVTIDFTGRIVTIDGEKVDLSPKEYDLLFYFAKNRNIALTRENLITNVWGYDFYGDDRTLDTHIKLLRKSLGPYSKFIVTLRGVGYRFEA